MKWQDPKSNVAGTLFGMDIIIDTSLSPGEILLIAGNGDKHIVQTTGDIAMDVYNAMD